MNIEEIKKWVKTAKKKENLVYFKGHLVEEVDPQVNKDEESRNKTKKIATFLLELADKGVIDLVQRKIKEGSQDIKPIYEYVVQKR